jgi:hypothetical protein
MEGCVSETPHGIMWLRYSSADKDPRQDTSGGKASSLKGMNMWAINTGSRTGNQYKVESKEKRKGVYASLLSR